jgi:hypothetical protein
MKEPSCHTFTEVGETNLKNNGVFLAGFFLPFGPGPRDASLSLSRLAALSGIQALKEFHLLSQNLADSSKAKEFIGLYVIKRSW